MKKMLPSERLEFAGRLKELREQKDLTASALAKLANVTPASVYQWERYGSSPRPKTLSTIAETFGVTTDYLVSGRRKDDPKGTVIAVTRSASAKLKEAPLEQLIKAIEAKGYRVSISTKRQYRA